MIRSAQVSQTLKYVSVGCCALGMLVTSALGQGKLSVECIPTSGLKTVTGLEVVTVECYVSLDSGSQVIAGSQLDFFCDLPGKFGSSGSIGGGVPFTNVIHGGFPSGDFLFGPDYTGEFVPGLGPTNPGLCTAGAAPPTCSPGPCPATLTPALSPAYMGEITYTVSECAAGEFNFDLEGRTVPDPDTADSTRILLEIGVPLPFNYTPNTFTVETGRCCDGANCLGDLNEHCCTVVNGGTWTQAATCATEPCPCFNSEECNNNLFCDGVETCNVNNVCDPGTFPCTNPNLPLCDEANDRCVFCFDDAECDDSIFCNGAELCIDGECQAATDLADGTPCGDPTVTDCTGADTCNGFGSCRANNAPNGTSCEDGDFCTVGSTCSSGICAGGMLRDCNDGLACTTDSCNEAADTCDNLLVSGFCLIAGACQTDGMTNPANDCEACITIITTDAWSPKAEGTACADDGNDCTADECLAGVCDHRNMDVGTPCDDGDPCTGTGGPGVGIDECDGVGNCTGTLDPECNDDCETAVEALEGSTPGNNENSGADSVEATCQLDSNHDIWFKYTATCTGVVLVTTTGSQLLPSNDTVLSVYMTCGGAEIACDDDGGPVLLSALTFGAVKGISYRIRVAGFEDNVGDTVLNIRTLDDCVIDGICYGENAVNPGNECEACVPDVSASSWSPRIKGTLCGNPTDTDCDSPDACDGAGTCEINFKPDGTDCTTDNNECTADVCDDGLCTHVDLSVESPCGSPTDTECDNPDSCDGFGSCLTNFEAVGTDCGDLTDTDCDNPDTCDGAGECLVNLEPDDTICTDDGVECTDDLCQAGTCTHPDLPAGEPCGSQDDSQCDHPDTCNGVGLCFENLEPDGTGCGDGDICTSGDVCISGECVGTPIPQAPIVTAIGARFLEVTPQPAGSVAPVALRVTSPDYPCLLKWIDMGGSLVDAPVTQLPSAWGTIIVSGPEVVPSTVYEVRAECGAHLSPPGSDTTWLWGDLNNDGLVDIDDVILILAGFGGDFTNATLENMDLFPCEPNGLVDIDEVIIILAAFGDGSYPCPPPC